MVDSSFWEVADEIGRKVTELRAARDVGRIQEMVEEIYVDALYLRLKVRELKKAFS